MAKISNTWLITLMLTVVISVIICSVSAADTNAQTPPNEPKGGGMNMDKILENLSAKGYDVKNIQTALSSGDNLTARKLLDDFWTAHPDARPPRPQMSTDQMNKIISNLSSKGNDVSNIKASLDGGNITEAQNLLDAFWKAHPELRPARNNNGGNPQTQ